MYKYDIVLLLTGWRIMRKRGMRKEEVKIREREVEEEERMFPHEVENIYYFFDCSVLINAFLVKNTYYVEMYHNYVISILF